MTTVASDQDRIQRLEQLDAEAGRAWSAYGEQLRELTGAEYEAAEAAAWEELQVALAPLHDARDELSTAQHEEPGLRT